MIIDPFVDTYTLWGSVIRGTDAGETPHPFKFKLITLDSAIKGCKHKRN